MELRRPFYPCTLRLVGRTPQDAPRGEPSHGVPRRSSCDAAFGSGADEGAQLSAWPSAEVTFVSIRFRGQAADSGRIDSSSGRGPTTSAWHLEASTSLGFKLIAMARTRCRRSRACRVPRSVAITSMQRGCLRWASMTSVFVSPPCSDEEKPQHGSCSSNGDFENLPCPCLAVHCLVKSS